MPPSNETRALAAPGLPKVSVSDWARAMPVVAINVRLKQMRLWAQRRWAKGPIFDHEAWLMIYSEGIARRYGGNPLKTVILRDMRAAHIDIEDEETIDNAIECARRSFEACPDHSAWSSAEIGKRLGVTFIERTEFFTHLGCGEKTKEQIAALRSEAKRARNAARDRRSGWVSQERLAPWVAAGVSRRTWFRKNAKAAHGGTEIGADRSKKENVIGLQKQCQPKIRVGVPKAPKRPSNESPLAKIVANPRDPILVRKSTGENLSSYDECIGGMSASNFDGEAPCIKLSASDTNANPLARAPLNASPTPAAGCQDGQRTVKPPHNNCSPASDAFCPADERSTALATWDQFDEPFDLVAASLESDWPPADFEDDAPPPLQADADAPSWDWTPLRAASQRVRTAESDWRAVLCPRVAFRHNPSVIHEVLQ